MRPEQQRGMGSVEPCPVACASAACACESAFQRSDFRAKTAPIRRDLAGSLPRWVSSPSLLFFTFTLYSFYAPSLPVSPLSYERKKMRARPGAPRKSAISAGIATSHEAIARSALVPRAPL